jgi:hypothetical protein
MENVINNFYLWFIAVMLILIFVPKDRISLMTKFFETILPRIPFTGMISAWRKDKE